MRGVSISLLAACAAAAGPAGLAVDIAGAGHFALSIGGKPWFSSNTTGVFTHGAMQTIENGGITVQSSSQTSGADAYGDFTRTAFQLKLTSTGEALETAIRDYTATDDVVIFEQVRLLEPWMLSPGGVRSVLPITCSRCC